MKTPPPSPPTPESLRAAGWSVHTGTGFTAALGGLWIHGADGQWDLGFFTGAEHGNTHPGIVHGGALMTFADIALGYGASRALDREKCVTAQLQVQFVSSPRIGDFVQCRPEVVRRSSQLVFMRGLLCVGDRTVVGADGIWKVLQPRAQG